MAKTKRFTVRPGRSVIIPPCEFPQKIELDGRLLKITPIEHAAKSVLQCEPTPTESRDASNHSAE